MAGPFIRWAFGHIPRGLPGLLAETERVVAFRHPRPSYPVHILIVPRRPVASLMALDGDDAGLLADVVQVTQSLVCQHGLERRGYRLVVNGGAYQEVAQLHFHLISD
jgi:histidine triad (HIT) family protein